MAGHDAMRSRDLAHHAPPRRHLGRPHHARQRGCPAPRARPRAGRWRRASPAGSRSAAGTTSASMTMVLRFTASEIAPAKAPNRSCGSWRSRHDGGRRPTPIPSPPRRTGPRPAAPASASRWRRRPPATAGGSQASASSSPIGRIPFAHRGVRRRGRDQTQARPVAAPLYLPFTEGSPISSRLTPAVSMRNHQVIQRAEERA